MTEVQARSSSGFRKLARLVLRLILCAILLEAAFLALLFLVPVFANGFAGLGVDLPASAAWMLKLPGWLLVLLALFLPALAIVIVTYAVWTIVGVILRPAVERRT